LHPLDAARQAMDVASGVLTGNAVAGVEAFVRQEGNQQQLEGMSDRELLTKASREMLVTIGLVCEVFRPQLLPLVAAKTTETATLMNALVAAFKAARDGLEQFEPDRQIMP
jgi:hypothetical protein